MVVKSAEDWDKFFCERYNHRTAPEWKAKSNFEMLSDMCDHIQLDAFKAGAEWAAKLVADRQEQYSAEGCEDRWNTCINIRGDINAYLNKRGLNVNPWRRKKG